MKITRRFTTASKNPFDSVQYERRTSRITNPDGSVVFEMNDAEVPAQWSQLATDIMVSKYFRKAGVPQIDSQTGQPLRDHDGNIVTGPEKSAKQVVHRLAGCWRQWGEKHGYFDTPEDAQAFYDELVYMLLHQMCAPNSPQWFNTGLNFAYGITGPSQGHYYCDPDTGEVRKSPDAYSRPQPHACFIQSIKDDLVNGGGIMDLWTREARLFKYGSGCTSGDSHIYVEGEGFIPIRNLFKRFGAQGLPVRDFDGKGRYIDVSALGLNTLSVDRSTGVYTLDRIERVWTYDVSREDKLTVRFDTGVKAIVSAWHPFLVWDGTRVVEKRADQLQRGDTVIGPNDSAVASLPVRDAEVAYETPYFRNSESHRVRIDADLAWLIGYFMGDGSLGHRRTRTTNKYGTTYAYSGLRLRFHDETVEALERVRSIVLRVFGEDAAIQDDGRGSNGKHLTYVGRKVTGFFAALSKVGSKDKTLRMPQFIWEAGADLVTAFLAGLIDSDGWVRDGRAVYATASHAFAKELAVLVSVYGFGGGVTRDRVCAKVTLLRRSADRAHRELLAAQIAHPSRRQRLLDYRPSAHERKFCMPLSRELQHELFGDDHMPADWLQLPVGEQGETLHLGRLQYEGLINPKKLEKGLALLQRNDLLAERLVRVARSAAFVTAVEPCLDDPDFYDLTVATHNNYLAGEHGLVAIHNTGTNFSSLRGENEALSGGGKSSGLMSFLKIGDRAAGAIKSGGTTRRAAKMVCLDLDHPDIEDFVNWKVREELKVAAMVEGLKVLPRGYRELAQKLGLKLDYDFNGEAYFTVSGQNSNNSVRIPNRFFKALEEDSDWDLYWRTSRSVAQTVKARELWEQISYAAWRCADPGVQYDDTINQWHTCPQSGPIRASNPCVTGDTRVLTPGGIWRRIDQMIHLPARIITNRDEQAIHVTEGAFPTSTRDVFELVTEGGYTVKLTADHKIWTRTRGWVEAQRLTTDDEIRLLHKPAAVEEVGEPQDPKFFQLLGLFLSDANNDSAALHLDACLPSHDIAEQFAHYITENWSERRYDDDYVNQLMLSHEDLPQEESGETLTATLTNRRLISRLKAFARLDSGRKRLSDEVFTAGLAAQRHLLRALFTADATLVERTLALRGQSLPLLRDVQTILLGFGIKSALLQSHDGGALPDRQATPPAPDPRDARGNAETRRHGLRIDSGSLRVFARYIGLLPGSKNDQLARAVQQAPQPDQTGNWDRFAQLRPMGKQQVFDLTEPVTSSFIANGLTVHNCSEYMFLDDTACNLASLNVLKFFDSDSRRFDIDAFGHAIRLWTIVLEISVLMASFPSEEIARLSYRFRTLGLGYANLGAMLMQAGIPYDSEKGRAICAAITSILTGESYATSAETARELGAFPGFDENRQDMLRVMRNHRRAAYDVAHNQQSRQMLGSHEGLDIVPVGIDATQFTAADPLASPQLLQASRECWDRAISLGEEHGYRNAQATVIAPTGTIGLLMDCDTTGVEPDFALVKFKKLAGGGYFKIANQSLPPALKNLGYQPEQIHEILKYVLGSLSLHGSPHVNHETLRIHGFTDEELDRIEQTLPSVFELSFAFSPWTLGAEFFNRMQIPEQVWKQPGFNLLRHLGFSKQQIDEANDHICGRGTVEGAPHLRPEHLAVFDCANKCGKHGTRFIAVDGHIRMMAASQPFISGAISKTINLPNEASVKDISDAYLLSWKLGLKANALYRDGSKLSQPLNVKSDQEELDKTDEEDREGLEEAREEVARDVAAAAKAVSRQNAPVRSDNIEPAPEHTRVIEKIVERIVERPLRRRLPDTRNAITHKFDVAGHEGYITVGLYEDQTPGEVFITMAKEGSTIGGLMDTIATLVSVALQYGVPVESLVRKFEHVRFEPSGMTRNLDIPIAKSLVDYIFRWLAMEFVPGYRAANAPKREKKTPASETARAIETEAGGEKKEGNGHGPRIAPDSAQPFDYEGEQKVSPPVPSEDARREKVAPARLTTVIAPDPVSQQGTNLQADAPACDVCGSITVRSGTCYKCLNCGNSMGCS